MYTWEDALGKRELVWSCGEKKDERNDLTKVTTLSSMHGSYGNGKDLLENQNHRPFISLRSQLTLIHIKSKFWDDFRIVQ